MIQRKRIRRTRTLPAGLPVILLLLLIYFLAIPYQVKADRMAEAMLEQRILDLQTEVGRLKMDNDSLLEEIQAKEDLLDGSFEVRTMELTFYAPLDPEAVEGICFSGDPTITASGAKVKIGVTVAADSSIPFGTWIWIEGHGWRQVQDRGGAIKGDRLDLAVATKAEALQLGRQKALVLIMRGGSGS